MSSCRSYCVSNRPPPPPPPPPIELLYSTKHPTSCFPWKRELGVIVSGVLEEKKTDFSSGEKNQTYEQLFTGWNLVPIVCCKEPFRRFGSSANITYPILQILCKWCVYSWALFITYSTAILCKRPLLKVFVLNIGVNFV